MPGTPSTARLKSGASAVSDPPMMPPWLLPSKNSRRVSITLRPFFWNAASEAKPCGWIIRRPSIIWLRKPCCMRSATVLLVREVADRGDDVADVLGGEAGPGGRAED